MGQVYLHGLASRTIGDVVVGVRVVVAAPCIWVDVVHNYTVPLSLYHLSQNNKRRIT